jgi:membrane protein implicated in regulation of membrane protease activity
MTAYLLSLFFGYTGADLFYLGFPILGAAKLATLGGLGLWWVIDIIRIGSAPVYAHDFRCAADLPHWAFVLTAVMFYLIVGFIIVGLATLRHRRRKRKDALLMQAEEEARSVGEYQPSTKHDHRHHHHKHHHHGHHQHDLRVPSGPPPMGPGGPYMHRM